MRKGIFKKDKIDITEMALWRLSADGGEDTQNLWDPRRRRYVLLFFGPQRGSDCNPTSMWRMDYEKSYVWMD